MNVSQIVQLLQSAVVFGTVIMFGAMGEILTEKSGNLNLGVPGIMYLGGFAGLAASFFYEFGNPDPNPVVCLIISFVAAFLAAALGGLIYSFLTITLRANQNVTGLTLTIFGGGLANFFGGSLNTMAGGVGQISVAVSSATYRTTIPGLASLTIGDFPIGSLLFGYGFMVFLAIITAVAMHFFLNRTRVGLNLRSVGENPATADSAGINVNRYKYMATCLGCMIAGLGGLYYVMDYASGIWANDAFGDRGWLAIALVIFTIWRPDVGVLASFLFGGLYILHMYIPSGMNLAVKELYKMLPYVVTIIVLIISSLRNQRDKQPPQSLGLPYFREDR